MQLQNAEVAISSPVAGADLRAALVASCLRGALPPVDLRAVCLVRAMLPVEHSNRIGQRMAVNMPRCLLHSRQVMLTLHAAALTTLLLHSMAQQAAGGVWKDQDCNVRRGQRPHVDRHAPSCDWRAPGSWLQERAEQWQKGRGNNDLPSRRALALQTCAELR